MLDGHAYSDIFIIGGGINGTAIAADAAGRGLSVTLCEKSDLASATSSASTKLIHGGLRYLENYELGMVSKALREREVLMKKAAYLISPLEFVLPHEKHLRPTWMIRLGLFIYDHLALHPNLPSSKGLNLKTDVRGQPLLPIFTKGFSYYDCRVDDARLVVMNALAAKQNGANILTRARCVQARRENNLWKLTVTDSKSNNSFVCYAKLLINAAGPWVAEVQKNILDIHEPFEVELVKGSHIVVPKFYEGDYAYILQNEDGRVVFTIPYQNQFTLIGTTDIPFDQNLDRIEPSDAEDIYLCNTINHYFKKHLTQKDIVWSYAGVRCLQAENQDNPAKITRDYKLNFRNDLNLMTVIGGKMTTHRRLAEETLDELKSVFPHMRSAWTAKTPLPGGEFPNYDFDEFVKEFKARYHWLPDTIANRYTKSYGTRANLILQNTNSIHDLGQYFGADLYQKEIEYLIRSEWAQTCDDIIWRRTKLGLVMTTDEVNQLTAWLDKYPI